jgi:uncharacterized protein DUF6941
LCDAATVREGLLHILGGGVTRAGRTHFPAPLALTLAIRILVPPAEADGPHKLVVSLQGEDGEEVARADVEFGVSDKRVLQPGEHASLSLPIAMPEQVQLPAPGRYTFELSIDDVHQTSVPFIAHEAEPPPLLPGPGGGV